MAIHRVVLLAVIILGIGFSPAHAQQSVSHPSPSQTFKPSQLPPSASYSPSFGRLSLQFGSGVLFGIGGGAVIGLASGLAAPDDRYRPLMYILNGFYFGYAATSALGIYLVANTSSYNASFGNILLGNGIGTALGIGTISLMESIDGNMGAAYIFAFAAPIVGGILANSMSINQRTTRSTALLNISDGSPRLSTPMVQLTHVGNQKISAEATFSPTVKLLNISL